MTTDRAPSSSRPAASRPAAPLALKPDWAEAARRWEAYLSGTLIDRPLVCVTAPLEGRPTAPRSTYTDRVFGDMDTLIEQGLTNARATFYGGEAMPTFWLSFGCDEPAVFCGARFKWSDDSPDTSWSVPAVEDWEAALPVQLLDDHPLWLRMQDFYRRAAERLSGQMLISAFDTHTNMDLLAALRGPQQLCLDLAERPELVDRAMEGARAVFPRLWCTMAEAARMDENGYCNGVYSMEGAAILQCDFSCMVSPQMFRRWILPALEEEAEVVRHVFYHWDGPGALMHMDDLLASRGIHTLGYVPTSCVDRPGRHIDCLDLLKRCQQGGKAVQAGGTPDEIKAMHRELDPERVMYTTSTASQAEAEELLRWFTRNT